MKRPHSMNRTFHHRARQQHRDFMDRFRDRAHQTQADAVKRGQYVRMTQQQEIERFNQARQTAQDLRALFPWNVPQDLLNQLKVVDNDGRSWAAGLNGLWYRWNGKHWVVDTPKHPLKAPKG
jgi:hypothetical protein